MAPGNRLFLGIDYHSSYDGAGCEPFEPAGNEPAPRQRKRDWHVNVGAKSYRDTEGKTDECPKAQTGPKRLWPDQQLVDSDKNTDQREYHGVNESDVHLVEGAPQVW